MTIKPLSTRTDIVIHPADQGDRYLLVPFISSSFLTQLWSKKGVLRTLAQS